MTELWYQNPKILTQNLEQFFPNKTLNRNEKINSLARFAIYYSVLVIIFNNDVKWLSVSAIILAISYFLGNAENFSSTDRELDPENCQPPTKDNPFMNYSLGDQIANPNRLPACRYEVAKDEMRKQFRSHLYSDSSDIWGKFISDRNFYTMPNTDIVNDQTGFAMWCFGNSGDCKSEGKNCLKDRDPVYHRGRITTIEDDTVY